MVLGELSAIPSSEKVFIDSNINKKTNLILVINMGIRVKARYENKVLKPLEGLDLKEGGMWR